MSLTKTNTQFLKGSISRVNKRFSSSILYQGESIVSNGANNTDRLISNNGLYMFVMQSDGNLVQYGFDTHPGGNIITIAWAFQTVNNYNFQAGPLTLTSSGNLIHYNNSGQNIWQVGANGAGVAPYRLVLCDNGNVVLYDSNNTIWWQNTSLPGPTGEISIINKTVLSLPGISGSYIDLGSNHPAHVNTTTDNMFFEAWIYPTSYPGNIGYVFSIGGDNSEDVGLWVSGQYGVNWRLWNTSSSQFTAPTGIPLVTYFWYHVAGSWNASTKTLYSFIDGTLIGSTVLTGTPRYDPISKVKIGAANQGDFYPFAGYIKDVRVIKGGTVPTSSFTPVRSDWALNALPSYASTGTNVLSFNAKYFQSASLSTRSITYIDGGNTIQSINGYRIHTFTTVGTQSFTVNGNVTAEVLIVAGGGGGGAGGGGAGGLVYYSSYVFTPGTYTVTVGAGANGATWAGSQQSGGNSSITGLTVAIGGGGGGSAETSHSIGLNGGSGGGGGAAPGNVAGGTGTSGQGYNGGIGGDFYYGGGGGAGGVGINHSVTNATHGAGGPGLQYSISGTPTYYAAGGGGGNAAGGTGGGGQGYSSAPGGNATTYGSGGGGSLNGTYGGNGYQGIVIIKYIDTTTTYGGTMQTINGRRIHTFTNIGTSSFTVNKSVTAQVLIVAGGASGGSGQNRAGGGGGAGGYVYYPSQVFTPGTYTITVGSGGLASGTGNGNPGGNSSVTGLTVAVGGGYGEGWYSIAGNGGSGGGGGSDQPTGGDPTSGQGYAGGGGTLQSGGGGGGASSIGQNSIYAGNGGNGGNGYTSSISGTAHTYSGGGGGGTQASGASGGSGGTGGGGNGGSTSAGQNATYYGGGGGGGGSIDSGGFPSTYYAGGNGYQGIVIISINSTSIMRFSLSPYAALYSFNTITFTNAGASGNYGPNIAQCISAYSGTNAWVSNISYFNTIDGIQIWTVPNSTTYNIELAGARGGNVWNTPGGPGRKMIINNVFLAKNSKLYIIVGQHGGDSTYGQYGSSISAGGGGATWIYNGIPNGTTNLLFVAGGGGGSCWNGNYGDPGQTTTAATAGGYSTSGRAGGAAGTNGGGGGGGVGMGNGYAGNNIQGGQGGPDYGSGGAGGGGGMGVGNYGATFRGGDPGGWYVITQFGGFGGGGGAGGVAEYGGRGGGGGYNGGGGGGGASQGAGGGGGSYGYVSWTDGGTNNTHGYVTITRNLT